MFKPPPYLLKLWKDMTGINGRKKQEKAQEIYQKCQIEGSVDWYNNEYGTGIDASGIDPENWC